MSLSVSLYLSSLSDQPASVPRVGSCCSHLLQTFNLQMLPLMPLLPAAPGHFGKRQIMISQGKSTDDHLPSHATSHQVCLEGFQTHHKSRYGNNHLVRLPPSLYPTPHLPPMACPPTKNFPRLSQRVLEVYTPPPCSPIDVAVCTSAIPCRILQSGLLHQ